jgi:hypothetical protein
MPQPYEFLDQFLSKITQGNSTPDDEPLEDENDFYDVPDEDEENSDQSYGQGSGNDDFMGDEPTEDNDNGNGNDDDPDNHMNDDYGYGNTMMQGFDEDAGLPPSDTPTGGAPGAAPTESLGNSISSRESQGKYTATNKHSSATGKYQFLWSAWGDSIKKHTGVKSKEEFLHNPKAQDDYFKFYEKKVLEPAAGRLEKYNDKGLSQRQLEQLVHFRGEGGARKYLQGKMKDQPEKYNVPISKYISQHQAGGVARTPGQQYTGLNNEHFDHMYFPMDGVNEFRGLDSGEPVYLQDETGKDKILKGNRHKAIMRGNIFEKRIK